MQLSEVHYSRPKPEAWDELVVQAQNILPAIKGYQRPFTPEAAANMLRHTDQLDTEALDSNLYYGLGLGMRGISSFLEDSKIKRRTTDILQQQFEAEGLDATRLFMGVPSRAVILSTFNAGTSTFQPLAQKSFQALPAAEQLTADCLTVTTRERRHQRPIYAPEGIVKDFVAIAASRGIAAANLTSSNAIAGSVEILRRATAAHLRVKTHQHSPRGITIQGATKLAAQGAMLHAEEFADPHLLNRLFTDDGQGRLSFNHAELSEAPLLPLPEDKATEILHTRRERCPALHVGRLMLLNQVLEVVWAAGQQARPIG